MGIDSAARQIMRQELEEALYRYDDYKKGYTIPYKLQPYLEILDEVDWIRGYVYSKIKYKHKYEHKALCLFLSGKRIHEIRLQFRKEGLPTSDITAWFYGDDEHEGFIIAMFDKFLKLNSYCPFCNFSNDSGKASGPKLSGTVCPCKEIEWAEEEE